MNELFDELLLCARYNDLDDIKHYYSSLSSSDIALLASKQDQNGTTIIHNAAANGHLEVLRFLLPLSSDGVNIPNSGGNTALHWSSLNGHLECVKILVEHGANVGIKNRVGRTAIDEAESGGMRDVVLYLLTQIPESELKDVDAALKDDNNDNDRKDDNDDSAMTDDTNTNRDGTMQDTERNDGEGQGEVDEMDQLD